jgi:hypothetical protein
MSEVPNFQLADDGKWYKRAIIGEPERWFICWDDDGPVEMLIRMMRTTRSSLTMSIYKPPEEIIKAFSLPFTLLSRQANLDCRFPVARRRWSNKMLQAVSYRLKQSGPIPHKLLITYDSSYKEKPDEEGVFYGQGFVKSHR